MRLQLRYHSDIDLSQPAMQVGFAAIARCLRDYPHGGKVILWQFDRAGVVLGGDNETV